MTKKGEPTVGEIDMGRGLISPVLVNSKVVHIPGNPVSTEIVRIRRDPDDIGTGHALES